MAKKKSLLKKFILFFCLLIIAVVGIGGYWAYKIIYQTNVSLPNNKSQIIYIPTGSNFDYVLNLLLEKNIIINKTTFKLLAEKKKYVANVKPGRYRILATMNNNQLVNLLRAGMQEPVQITINTIRSKEQLIERVCDKIEAKQSDLKHLLNDNNYLNKRYGMTSDNVLILFIPNSYQFYWNTSAEEFLDRMAKEYKYFWTEERKKKARNIGLSQTEVSVLASIVQAEQSRFNDEKPIIAGLYINRLKKHIPLQSDPTLICAIGDYTITRVLNEHKTINSPYNTYKNLGLPPGPICLAEISSIDAVLNFDKNDYLYMCAKEDFSGKHNFSKSLDQHNSFAAKYRKALDRNNIFR